MRATKWLGIPFIVLGAVCLVGITWKALVYDEMPFSMLVMGDFEYTPIVVVGLLALFLGVYNWCKMPKSPPEP